MASHADDQLKGVRDAGRRAAPRGSRLFDPDFRTACPSYIGQCLMATVSIFAVLLVLDSVTQTVLVASLGASAFIAFTMPHIEASRPRYLLGGYALGTLVGCSFSLLSAALAADYPALGLALVAQVASSPGQTFLVALLNAPLSQALDLTATELSGSYLVATLASAALQYRVSAIGRAGHSALR
jgi:CBS-domain-containing membrane protein